MSKYQMNGITVMQYIFLIHGAQVGTGVLSLPRIVAEKSGTDGWICIVLAWVINCLTGWIMLLTLRKYPNHTLPDLFDYLFGKWLGKLLLLPLIAYFAFFGWIIMINSMLYIKAWFLTKTPEFLIVLLFSVPSYLVVRNGLRVQARYVEFIFYLMAWMPLFLLFPLEKGHLLHLLPVFKEGWGPIISGMPSTIFGFAGFEILYFIYPFLQKKQYALQGFLIANTMTMLLYLYVTLVCFIFYTPDGITTINQPVLSLLKNIEFRFLERFDMIFLALYLLIVSKTWIPYVYCTAFSTCHMLKKQDHSWHAALYFMLVIVLVFVIQPTWNQSDQWQKLVSKFGSLVIYVLPVVLYAYVQGREMLGRRRTG